MARRENEVSSEYMIETAILEKLFIQQTKSYNIHNKLALSWASLTARLNSFLCVCEQLM